MNTLNYINISHAENIKNICMRYLEDILNGQKSKFISSIKFLGLIVLTPIHYIYSIYSVNRFSVSYLEHFIKSNKLDDKAIKIFLKKEYSFFLKVKTIPLYYYKWEKNSIDESFDYFETVYTFKNFIEVKRQRNQNFSNLKMEHMEVLHDYIKKLKLFNVDISFQQVCDMFLHNKVDKPFVVSHLKKLANFFHELKESGYLNSNWRSIAAKGNFFISEEGNMVLSGNLSSSTEYYSDLKEDTIVFLMCIGHLKKC